MREMRILGPPGTGKSTRLATEEIPNAIDRYGNDKVLVTSFTKAAAKEISTKESLTTGQPIDLPGKHVGTLHKFCFQMFGQPTLAQTKISEWNNEYPDLAIRGGSTGSVDNVVVEETGTGDGDAMLSKLNICRAKLVPRDRWPKLVQNFEEKWTRFKNDLGMMDFTDLIERAAKELPYAPGRPEVIFVDEAQDFTALQLKLVRSWSAQAKWLVLVGDDDQTIFSFAGATPDAFINPPINKDLKRVLSQSYRVPRAVHQKAMDVINLVSLREPKEYAPRDFEGKVRCSGDSYKELSKTISEIKSHLSDGKSVMFLATCSYMLNELITELRSAGIPFSNRYRKNAGNWNPLSRGGENRITSVDLLEAFYDFGEDNGYWTVPQFLTWAKFLKTGETGLIRKQGKAAIKALEGAVAEDAQGLHTTREVLGQVLSPGAVEPALNRDLVWLKENMQAARKKSLEYPIRVLSKNGEDALTEPPGLTIGTIHSVKGGQADIVYLCPDISFKAAKQKKNNKPYTDSLWRLFYVGITRTKEELVLMQPATQKVRGNSGLAMELERPGKA